MDQNPARAWIFLQEEGVMLSFPGHEGKIQVIQQATGVLKDMPGIPDGFQPYRLVINLKLTHVDQPEAPILKFYPPIELLVRYTADDYIYARGNPRMAYWDGKQWVVFGERQHFHIEEDDKVKGRGWAVVRLSEWGDPPIAVGT